MRLALYYNNNDIRIEERPVPKIGDGELLVKVIASGICGSDVMEWYRIKKAPLVLGHEIAGEIVEVGRGVERYKEGNRVFVSHHVPCNTCQYCLSGHPSVCETLRITNFDPGGFAEFIRVPDINVDRGVYLLPDDVSFEEGTFIEPLGCVFRGQRLAGMAPGKRVIVIGSGISGLLHVQMARAFGASRIVATDINEYKLEAALKLGADAVIRADEDVPIRLRHINAGWLADMVILCTGATSAITQALQSVERGGVILFFAPTEHGIIIPISLNDLFWRTEITLTSSYAASPADLMVALEMIRGDRVNVRDMITHRLGLSETGLGFQLVSKAQDSIKVIIEPQR